MRYIVLVLLNLPVIFLAFLNLVTKYKLKRINVRRFRVQLTVWVMTLILLVGSYPIYNYLSGRYLLDSYELSLFDIAQTTAVIWLFYMLNNLRQSAEWTDQRLRDLHQQLSIITSTQNQAPRNSDEK